MKGDTISEVCVCASKVLRQYRIPKEVDIDGFSAAMKQGSLRRSKFNKFRWVDEWRPFLIIHWLNSKDI